jgi:ADP-heptose:LPS heptosyltransferase
MRPIPNSCSFTPAVWDSPKKILLIRWKSLGDVLFTLPAFRSIRANFPDSHITYMTSREYTPLIEGFSGVDQIFPLDRAQFKRFGTGGIKEAKRLWSGIIGTHYDLVVDFQGYGETAWLSWLTRAPERWGQVYRETRAKAYTRAVKRADTAHPVDEHLRFLSECGLKTRSPENIFSIPAEKKAAAEKLFQQFRLERNLPAVFIQPFTSSPGKNWPLDRWLELARRLRDMKIQVLFGGGPLDRTRLEAATMEKFPVAAGADILTSAGLAALCNVVVGGDTGLLHLATASGCRVITLENFGSTQCPYAHPDWSIKPQRRGQAIDTIDPNIILAEIRRVIAG